MDNYTNPTEPPPVMKSPISENATSLVVPKVVDKVIIPLPALSIILSSTVGAIEELIKQREECDERYKYLLKVDPEELSITWGKYDVKKWHKPHYTSDICDNIREVLVAHVSDIRILLNEDIKEAIGTCKRNLNDWLTDYTNNLGDSERSTS